MDTEARRWIGHILGVCGVRLPLDRRAWVLVGSVWGAGMVWSLWLLPVATGGALTVAGLVVGILGTLCLGVGTLAAAARIARQRTDLAAREEAVRLAEAARAEACRRAEAAAAEAGGLVRALEGCPPALAITDRDGRVRFANPGYADLMGAQRDQIEGHTIPFLQNRTLTASQEKSLRRAIAAGRDWHGEFWQEDGRGRCLFLHARMVDLAHADGDSDGLLFAFDDGTDRRRLQEQFLQSQKMEIIGRLAGGVVHDLSNMLTVIMGIAQIVQSQLDGTHAFREDIDEIVRVTERASTLNRQLLTFARTRAHHAERVELDAAVQELDRFLQRTLGEDVTLRLELSAGASALTIDPGQFNQLLMNLAVNARDAMPRGGELVMATRLVDLPVDFCRRHDLRPGRYLRLSVRDTGIGMSQDVLNRLFEPFFTTKAEGQGTGLGLSTVREIVHRFRGCIEVRSRPGEGSEFEIHFPLCKIDSVAVNDPVWESVPGGTETILVVEDDPDVRRLMAALLKGLGYHVLSASTGREALSLCTTEAHSLDVLVTDVIMPEMNGVDLAGKLRTLVPDLGVILTTGFAEHPIVARTPRKQYDHIIRKPFNRAKLAGAVREVLEARRSGHASSQADEDQASA